jgi:hypothetical protein
MNKAIKYFTNGKGEVDVYELGEFQNFLLRIFEEQSEGGHVNTLTGATFSLDENDDIIINHANGQQFKMILEEVK